MKSYMETKLQNQTVKAWEDILILILEPEDFKQINIRFKDGKVRFFGPKHIIEKFR